ncbi:MAG: fibronectin type III domain-containing protein [Thaumarchaeota archaeon]|nr:fibronectin type III domain-containing protein [Nitrososphaerota archaeon]
MLIENSKTKRFLVLALATIMIFAIGISAVNSSALLSSSTTVDSVSTQIETVTAPITSVLETQTIITTINQTINTVEPTINQTTSTSLEPITSTNQTINDVLKPAGIVLNNVQSTSGATSSSDPIILSGFNAATGNDRLLLVGISANNNDVASVTFGGVELTRAVSSFVNNNAEIWYLVNPSDTADIIVTMSGSTDAVVGAYAFSDVDQADPVPTTATNSATTSSNPSITIITKYPSDWVIEVPSIYGGSTLDSPSCTQKWNINIPDAITGASSSKVVSFPAVVTCSWKASNAELWDDVAVELKAADTTIFGLGSTTPPTNLVANTVSESQIDLSWTAPSASLGDSLVTGYKIERSIDSDNIWSTIVPNTLNRATTYADDDLSANTTYVYRVSAINPAGTSPPSNTASATTENAPNPTAPQPPTGLRATAVSSSQINLSWTAPSNNGGSSITEYQIERSTDGTTWSTISNTGNTSTTYSDTGLNTSTTYTYRVSAINSTGTSQPSNTASATTFETSSGGITVYAHRIPADYWDPCFAATCDQGTGPGVTMWVALYNSDGGFITGGFTDENGFTFTNLNPAATYYVYPTDCENCHGDSHDVVFQYWGDNQSNVRPRAATVGENLDAWYSCTNNCAGVS